MSHPHISLRLKQCIFKWSPWLSSRSITICFPMKITVISHFASLFLSKPCNSIHFTPCKATVLPITHKVFHNLPTLSHKYLYCFAVLLHSKKIQFEFVHITWFLKYIKQKLIELKGKNHAQSWLGILTHPSKYLVKEEDKKISNTINNSSNTFNQFDLIDIYRTLHQTAAKAILFKCSGDV